MRIILSFLILSFSFTAVAADKYAPPPSPGAYSKFDGYPVPTRIVDGKQVQAGITYKSPVPTIQIPQINTMPNLQPSPLITIDPRVFLPPQ